MITALFSDDAKYRWWLKAELDNASPYTLTAFMLNPSVAGSVSHGVVRSDPTVTRMCKRAHPLYGRLYVINLFGLISTYPKHLYAAADPVGRDNDAHIHNILNESSDVVVAWGPNGAFLGRDLTCLNMIYNSGRIPLCLGLTQDGFPKHPLHIAYAVPFVKYTGRFARPEPSRPGSKFNNQGLPQLPRQQ
jgi:hypothetical protein